MRFRIALTMEMWVMEKLWEGPSWTLDKVVGEHDKMDLHRDTRCVDVLESDMLPQSARVQRNDSLVT
jgi:hypothetical protein